MSSYDVERELADQFERTAEGFWVRGLSLENARKAAVRAMVETADHQDGRGDPRSPQYGNAPGSGADRP